MRGSIPEGVLPPGLTGDREEEWVQDHRDRAGCRAQPRRMDTGERVGHCCAESTAEGG